VVKDSRIELLLPGMQHSFVERNLDLNWRPDPVSVTSFVFPTILDSRAITPLLSAQSCINKPPILASNILWPKIWMPNYLYEVLKGRL
jgi:hypothetical protein